MNISRIGIVAGRGNFPALLKKHLASKKIPHFVLGIQSFADKKISDKILPIGKLGQAIKTFQKENVSHVVFIGGLDRPARDQIKPDLKGWIFLLTHALKIKGDNSLLTSLASVFEKAKMTVIGIDDLMPSLLVQNKCYTKIKPTTKQKKSITYGFQLAKKLGEADIGQSVVVQENLCLGLEAIEGTDALIKRCALLSRGKKKPILVKTKKPNQDRRVDLPTIGLSTIKNAIKGNYAGIVAESENVLFSDKEKSIALANKHGLFILGVSS